MSIGKAYGPILVQGPRINISCEYIDMGKCLCVLVDVKGEQPSYDDGCQCTPCRIDLLEMRYKQQYTITETGLNGLHNLG